MKMKHFDVFFFPFLVGSQKLFLLGSKNSISSWLSRVGPFRLTLFWQLVVSHEAKSFQVKRQQQGRMLHLGIFFHHVVMNWWRLGEMDLNIEYRILGEFYGD